MNIAGKIKQILTLKQTLETVAQQSCWELYPKRLNLFATMFLIFNHHTFCEINLKISDLDGSQINEVGIGVPFLLKVELINEDNNSTLQKIAGLDCNDITHSYNGTNTMITSINGKVNISKIYSYTLTINKEDEFVFGPEIIGTQGTKTSSNTATIKVSSSVQNQNTNDDYKFRFKWNRNNNRKNRNTGFRQTKSWYIHKPI